MTIIKTCKTHGALTEEQCNITATRIRCKQCQRATANAHYAQHKDKNIKRVREYRNNNKDKVRKMKYDSWIRNKEKYVDRRRRDHRKYSLRAKANLEDNYVKSCLQKRSGLRYKDMPNELVELKRAVLMIRRSMKMSELEKKHGSEDKEHKPTKGACNRNVRAAGKGKD
jgi:hypothetical protein